MATTEHQVALVQGEPVAQQGGRLLTGRLPRADATQTLLGGRLPMPDEDLAPLGCTDRRCACSCRKPIGGGLSVAS